MIMKKLGTVLCLSSALLVSTVAQSWEGNWLVGGSLGFSNRAGSFDYVELQRGAALPFTQQNYKPDLAEDSWLLGLFGGWQTRHNNIVMGLELAVDWLDDDDDMHFNFTDPNRAGWAATVNYKREFAIALSARFGYQLTSWIMPYARLGVSTSHDHLEYSAASSGTALAPAGVVVNIDDSHQNVRFLTGVGAELPIPQYAGLSVRAEYNHESRGKALKANGIGSDNATQVFVSTAPYANTGKLSLVWNFV
jgi:opacity protein-like surface antigen